MTKKVQQKITDAELGVLKLLWDKGPLTAKAISRTIYPKGSPSAFASVHSFLKRLERKGLVERDRSLYVHMFRSAVRPDEVVRRELEALADRIADGSMAPFLKYLIEKKRLTSKEASKIRKLLQSFFA